MFQRIWLLTIEALDPLDNPITLRFSSGDYIDPSGNYYDLRIKQPALFSSGAYTGSVIQTSSRSAFGETTLVNTDGGLDYLADYAVDGRVSILSLRDEEGIITPVITGTIRSLSFQDNIVSVLLRDPQEVLELPHPSTTYLGNNVLPDGLEGTENDIKGKVKPQTYGKVRNVEPVLVNSSQLIYQIHDQDILPTVHVDVTHIYDRGVELTKGAHYTDLSTFLAAGVPSGHFTTYEGYFKLGSTPTGTVTCDVDSLTFLLGDVFDLICSQAGYSLTSTDKTTLNSYGQVGIYLSDLKTTSSLLDLLSSTIGGYWYFESSTVIRARQLVAPTSPEVFIDDFQISSISRSSTGAGSNGLPIYRIKLKADKVEVVQNDLAGSVDNERRARISTQFREAVYESLAVRNRHPLSEEVEIETAFRNLPDAQVQSDRLGMLLGVRRDTVEVVVRLDSAVAGIIDIGTVVNLRSYKLGYLEGKDFVVLGYTLDARLSRLTLELFG